MSVLAAPPTYKAWMKRSSTAHTAANYCLTPTPRDRRNSMSDQDCERLLRRFVNGAVKLGQPVNDPKHVLLNAMLKERGWTDEQINHAHEVARGNAPLSEACPNCENQELYYSQSLMYEGH